MKCWIIAILLILLYSSIGGTESFLFNTSSRRGFATVKSGDGGRGGGGGTDSGGSPSKCKLSTTERNDQEEETKVVSTTMTSSDEKSVLPQDKEDEDKNNKKFQVQTRNPLRWLVLRLGFTEPAMISPFNYGKYDDGIFKCAYCGHVLFDSNSKYDSGSGWPSFWRSDNDKAITYKQEWDGRLECRCARCSSHLGHVFLDGPNPASVPIQLLEQSPTSDPRGRFDNSPLPRFCINGAAMTFEKKVNRELGHPGIGDSKTLML